MKLIRIEDLSGVLPAGHHNLLSRRIAEASIGAKAMGVSLVCMEPNAGADPHIHEKAEQLFIVLKGEMVVKTAQAEVRLKQGEAVFIYPGEVHENHNIAEGETEYIVVTSSLTP
ncbi:cupin domain-containing protein [Chloroflexota bacterium]